MAFIHTVLGGMDLQRTLVTNSSGSGAQPAPHHPITCTSELRYYEDGRFGCEHAEVEAGDDRTQKCLDYTVAVLLFEALYEREKDKTDARRDPDNA